MVDAWNNIRGVGEWGVIEEDCYGAISVRIMGGRFRNFLNGSWMGPLIGSQNWHETVPRSIAVGKWIGWKAHRGAWCVGVEFLVGCRRVGGD